MSVDLNSIPRALIINNFDFPSKMVDVILTYYLKIVINIDYMGIFCNHKTYNISIPILMFSKNHQYKLIYIFNIINQFKTGGMV